MEKMFSLLSYNTFGIDVKAARFIEYHSVEEFGRFIANGCLDGNFLHIGSGSNLLFTQDYDGTILHSCIKGIDLLDEDDDSVILKVGAGEIWDDFVAYCVQHGWYGAENLSLIPGEVGASAVQNIGAYGVEVKDLIVSVETVDNSGELHTYSKDECIYSYRNSIFKRSENKKIFVTAVVYRLGKHEHFMLDYGAIRRELSNVGTLDLKSVREAVISIRRSKLPDPKVVGNAGSFFINPIVTSTQFSVLQRKYPEIPFYKLLDGTVKIPAGWMIDQCGWKGKSLGRAGVYAKQALVLVNLGGAEGKDIIALSDAVRHSVRQKFGIDIHSEVNII